MKEVISTYVEMILSQIKPDSFVKRDLHVCGDDPNLKEDFEENEPVISTYVEMILITRNFCHLNLCDLHVCGDDPMDTIRSTRRKKWSPRMWRWSYLALLVLLLPLVISTYVEMILNVSAMGVYRDCDLHVCGDDP